MAKATPQVRHHDTDGSCCLQWLEDKIKALVYHPVFRDTSQLLFFMKEFRYREEGQENEGVVGCLCTKVHVQICQTNEERVRHSITCHYGDVGFV